MLSEKLETKGQFPPWLKLRETRTPRFGGRLLGPWENWEYRCDSPVNDVTTVVSKTTREEHGRATRCSIEMQSDDSSINGPWAIKIIDGETSRTADFDGIIDLNGLGELVGVEILDFRRQTGAIAPRPVDSTLARYGYDAEIDAFYLHVEPGNAPIQKRPREPLL
jgi:uncharacterized protein YuzE